MLDRRLNPELDLAAVSNVEIVLAENNVKAFPHAMTCCNVTKCYSRRLISCFQQTSQYPIWADQRTAAESFFVPIEYRDLPWPLKCFKSSVLQSNVNRSSYLCPPRRFPADDLQREVIVLVPDRREAALEVLRLVLGIHFVLPLRICVCAVEVLRN